MAFARPRIAGRGATGIKAPGGRPQRPGTANTGGNITGTSRTIVNTNVQPGRTPAEGTRVSVQVRKTSTREQPKTGQSGGSALRPSGIPAPGGQRRSVGAPVTLITPGAKNSRIKPPGTASVRTARPSAGVMGKGLPPTSGTSVSGRPPSGNSRLSRNIGRPGSSSSRPQGNGIPTPGGATGGATGGSRRGSYYMPSRTDSGIKGPSSRGSASRRIAPVAQTPQAPLSTEVCPGPTEQDIPLPEEWTSSMRELYTLQRGEYEAVDETGEVQPRVVENIIVEKDMETYIGGREEMEAVGQIEDGGSAPCQGAETSYSGARAQSPLSEVSSRGRSTCPSSRGGQMSPPSPSHGHPTPLGRPPRSVEQVQQRTPTRDVSPCLPQVTQRVVSPSMMDSPAGLIESQQEFVLERITEASPRSVMVDTRMTGTMTVVSGQAEQIEVLKKDMYMPQGEQRPQSPMARGIASPASGTRTPPRTPRATCPGSNQGSPQRTPQAISASARYRDSTPRSYGPGMSRGSPYQGPSPSRQTPSPTVRRSPPKVTTAGTPDYRGFSPVGTPDFRGFSPVGTAYLEGCTPIGPCTDLDTLKKMIEEENNDVDETNQLITMSPSSLSTQKKLKVLRSKSRSLRLLEESLDQCLPHDDQGGEMQSDLVAALMYSEESGIPVRSPPHSKRSFHKVMEDAHEIHDVVNVSSVAPSPMQDFVVPTGRQLRRNHSFGTREISSTIHDARSFDGQSMDGRMPTMDDELDMKMLRREKKARDRQIITHTGSPIRTPGRSSQDPRYDLEAEVPPWDGEFESRDGNVVNDLLGAQPSDSEESFDTQHLDYILDYEPPKHYSRAQLRGSTCPSWFPGYYSAFPETQQYVKLEKKPSRVFKVAWNSFRPDAVLQNSEIIIV